MKVKLFWKNNPMGPASFASQFRVVSSCKNAKELEAEINAWLADNPSAKIVDIKQTASGGSFGASLWFISVWYEQESA